MAWVDDRAASPSAASSSGDDRHVQLEQSQTDARVTALEAGQVYAVDDSEVTAVEAGTVYAADDRGVIAWRVRRQGRVEALDDDPDASVFDAENGTTRARHREAGEAR